MTPRRSDVVFYIACLVLGGLSAMWWMSNPAPIELIVVLLMGFAVVGGTLLATLLLWVEEQS